MRYCLYSQHLPYFLLLKNPDGFLLYSLFSVAESFLLPIQSPSKIPNQPPKDKTGHDTRQKQRSEKFSLSCLLISLCLLSLCQTPNSRIWAPAPTLETRPAGPNSKSHSSQHSHPKIISFLHIPMLAHKSDLRLCSEKSLFFLSHIYMRLPIKKPKFAMVK